MTYNEYANLLLKESQRNCTTQHPLTIRGQMSNWAYGVNQEDDERDIKDASIIIRNGGIAKKIFSASHEGGFVHFTGAVRCGDYIYIPDWERIPEYDWNYYIDHQEIAGLSDYYAHVVEYCISTGETIVMNLGKCAGSSSIQGELCVIEERKLLYYDDAFSENVTGAHFYIVDFQKQTVEETLYIKEYVTADFSRYMLEMCVIRDKNEKSHMFVISEFFDDTKLYTMPDYTNAPGAAGFTIFHKVYGDNMEWEILDIPIDTQDREIELWDYPYAIIGNRYLVVFGFREEGVGYGPIYLVNIVYDIETGDFPKEYDLQSSWGESWWDLIGIESSSADNTNDKLYGNMYNYMEYDDSRDFEFNPATGEFIIGTNTVDTSISRPFQHNSHLWLLFSMTSKECSYFWNEETKYFSKASENIKLGNYDVDVMRHVPEFPYDHNTFLENVSNLLDYNGGGNPLIWFWNYSGSSLMAVDIIEGEPVYDAAPSGFAELEKFGPIWVSHMGDSILLATENFVVHFNEGGTANVGCTQIDYYLVTGNSMQ